MNFPISGKKKRGSHAAGSQRWKTGLLIFQCLELLLLCGCSPERVPAEFDGENARNETALLEKIRPRCAGTVGAQRAAKHLEEKLAACGFKTSVDTFLEETPDGKTGFNNVLGRLPGSTRRVIVLGTHFDTKAGRTDVGDSGGVGVLLELARVLSESGPYETEFLVAFFDGQECVREYGPNDGLHGSRRLALQLADSGAVPYVEAVILLDLIGGENLTVSVDGSQRLTKELFFAAHEVGARPTFGLAKGTVLNDHIPFVLAGFPAVSLIDAQIDESSTQITVSSSEKGLQTIGDTVLRMIENLQDSKD